MFQNVIYQARLGSLLIGLWLLQACSAPEDNRPDNLIPEERMADILADIHIAEARVGRMGITVSDSSNVIYKRLEKQIFRKFKVDTAVYTKSYVFYSSHPEAMESVYKRVTEKLKKKTETQKPTRS